MTEQEQIKQLKSVIEAQRESLRQARVNNTKLEEQFQMLNKREEASNKVDAKIVEWTVKQVCEKIKQFASCEFDGFEQDDIYIISGSILDQVERGEL